MISIAIINIRTALQEQVQGDVQVKVSSRDVLYISITQNNQRWNWYLEEITEQLHCGVSCDQIIDYCLRAYKRYIYTLFMKNQ